MSEQTAIVLGFKKHPLYGNICHAKAADIVMSEPDGDGYSTCLDWLYKTIGCKSVDCTSGGLGVDIWCDDEGLYNGSAVKFNWAATQLRNHRLLHNCTCCLPAGYPPIAGVCILARHTPEGDTVGLTAEQIAYIKGIIGEVEGL